MKKSNFVKTLFYFFTFFLFGCAEDDFTVSSQSKADDHISFSMGVVEMEDIDKTRGGEPHHNRAHHVEMTGAKTPMYVRFTQEKVIDKYLGAGRQGVLGTQEDTRGRRIDSIPDFYDDFGLISFRYDVTETWAMVGNSITPYVYNEQVRRADEWRTSKFWPGTGRNLTFFAYAPYNAQGVELSPATDLGTPWLHHEVPEDAIYQSDLLISAYEHAPGNYNAVRHIDFKHICAGVRFAIGSQMAPGKITKIQLADVYGEGWYHFGESAWDSVKTEKTFTLDQDFYIAPGEQNRLLTTGDNVFMMVPQVVPRDGRILVTINDGEDHELEAFISHDNWDIGTTTTYWLSTLVTGGDTILSVSRTYDPSSPSGVPATGGTATYEVRSYYTTAYGTRTPIPWTAYYTIDDDTTKYSSLDPEALSAFTFSGGSAPVQTCDITAKQGAPRSITQITKALKGRAVKNEDLAIGSDKKGSANCYVVNNPGTYTFPCVYGNGIDKNGNAKSTSSYLADNFVNHAGTKISDVPNCPKIPESDIGDAVIVWQDAYHLITPSSLQIVNKNGFKCVQFTIDSLNICQGNAVVAVRNSDYDIMWSWHIWVTNYDLEKTIRIDNANKGGIGTIISFMAPAPLGYCDRDTIDYTARTFHLTTFQPASGKTARIDISQLSSSAYLYGVNAPFYQWGRKDLLLASDGTGSDKQYFDATYPFSINSGSSNSYRATLEQSVLYPNIMYGRYDNDWCSTTYYNLWNLNFNSNVITNNTHVTKTVYDPCPPGFKLPCTGFSTGFNESGTNENTNSNWITLDGVKGGNMPTRSTNNPSGNPSYLFFPALGVRNLTSTDKGKIYYESVESDYWTCGTLSDERGINFYTQANKIYPQDRYIRGTALPVWPVSEDSTP